jgi:hypothetical protein
MRPYRFETFALLDDDCAGAEVFDGADAVMGAWFAMFMLAVGWRGRCKIGGTVSDGEDGNCMFVKQE